MWNKSIIVAVVLLWSSSSIEISARSLTETDSNSCSAIKGLLDTMEKPSSAAATTQKGESCACAPANGAAGDNRGNDYIFENPSA